MTTGDPLMPSSGRAFPWSGLVLALAIGWAVAARWPLILNAPHHLDSDLAVDGLTLVDALHGHWRWHYPGTPYIGTAPLFLSLPQALAFGPTPAALVSGGAVAFVLLMVGTFCLTRRAFGPNAAAWSVVPLAFASTGAVWLSGRITGGHVLAAAWHAGTFAWLAACLKNGGRASALGFGIWCGLGLWIDSMFAVTLTGLVPAAMAFWVSGPTDLKRSAAFGLLFLVGFAAGLAPRVVGTLTDPYSSYDDQFSLITRPAVVAEHARLLSFECLPRLVAGHRLPGLEADPNPATVNGPPLAYPPRVPVGPWAMPVTVVALAVCGASWLRLTGAAVRHERVGRAVAFGLILSALATLAGFVLNRNIFNSDNYRYLVGLIVPGGVGFGLLAAGLVRRGRNGTIAAVGLTTLLAVLMTGDLVHWYARFGWVASGRAVQKPLNDPLRSWLDDRPEVAWIEGGYWDVYRLAFLTGRVRGVPFPVYPNRFPGWVPPKSGRRAVIAGPTPDGATFGGRALREGGQVVFRTRGSTVILRPE